MPEKQILKITADGSKVLGLYTDLLVGLGESTKIVRASEVEYDNALGGWTVKIVSGPFSGKVFDTVFEKRADALAAEREFFNRLFATEGYIHE
jgi:hypothetical protein